MDHLSNIRNYEELPVELVNNKIKSDSEKFIRSLYFTESSSLINKQINSDYLIYDSIKTTIDSKGISLSIENSLLMKINNTNIENYLRENIKERRKYLIKKQDYNDLMSFQSNELKHSLIELSEENEEKAKKCFSLLLSFLKIRNNKFSPISNIVELINIVFYSNRQLNDEIFLHFLKQTRQNPNPIEAWKALAILSSSIVPSESLLFSILNYILMIISKENNDDYKEIVEYSNVVFTRLLNFSDHPRKYPPSTVEINYVENLKPILIIVNLFSGEEVFIQIESYSTIRDLKNKTLQKILNENENISLELSLTYGIYEIKSEDGNLIEKYIEESEYVCDLLSIWSIEMEIHENGSNENRENNQKGMRRSIFSKFYLKKLLNIDENVILNNSKLYQLYYYEVSYEYIRDVYLIKDFKTISILSSLKIIIDNNINNIYDLNDILKSNLERYIPCNVIDYYSKEQWSEILEYEYSGYIGKYTTSQLMSIFIKKMTEEKTYSSICFDVYFPNKESNPLNLMIDTKYHLRIYPDSICIYNSTSDDYEMILSVELNKIVNWGVSSFLVVFVITNDCAKEGDCQKIYLSTRQGKTIQYVMEYYTKRKIDFSLKEIDKSLISIGKRFSNILSVRDIVSL